MKQISINHLLVLFFSLVLCSCAALRENSNRQKLLTTNQFKIENGMSKQQVIELFGNPCNSQFNGQDEAWQYCYTGSINSAGTANNPGTVNNHYIIVWFSNATVTGMSSYDNISESLCDSYFKTIHWEDSPGRVIEIRNR